MATQVRNAVFETNSSSSHSVVLSTEELKDHGITKKTLRDGVIRAEVYPEGYGWQWVRFYKPENVLAYLLYQAANRMFNGPKRGVDLSEKLRANPTAKFILDTVENATGCKVEFVFPEGDDAHFYVDHDSMGNGLEFAREGREDELLDLVFGRNSYIEMGNDNSPPGEYIVSDIGDVLTSPGMHIDEVLDGEAPFELEFSTGWGDSSARLVDHSGETHEGLLHLGRIHNVVHEMRAVTLTEVSVQMAPVRRMMLDEGLAIDDVGREVFFQWLNRANKPEQYSDDPSDHPSVNVLRNLPVSVERLAGKPGYGLDDEKTRITMKGFGSAEVIEKMTSVFEEMAAIPAPDYSR